MCQLDEIAEYIAVDSPTQAKRVVRRVLDGVERLATFPESGAFASEFPDDGVREILVYRFRILYRFVKAGDAVRIVGIVHGARLLNENLIE